MNQLKRKLYVRLSIECKVEDRPSYQLLWASIQIIWMSLVEIVNWVPCPDRTNTIFNLFWGIFCMDVIVKFVIQWREWGDTKWGKEKWIKSQTHSGRHLHSLAVSVGLFSEWNDVSIPDVHWMLCRSRNNNLPRSLASWEVCELHGALGFYPPEFVCQACIEAPGPDWSQWIIRALGSEYTQSICLTLL